MDTKNLNDNVAKTNATIDSLFTQVLDRLEIIAKDSTGIAGQFATVYVETDDKKAKEAYGQWKKRAAILAATVAGSMLSDPMISPALKERIIRAYPNLLTTTTTAASTGQRQLPAPQPQPQQQQQQGHPANGLAGTRPGTIIIDEPSMAAAAGNNSGGQGGQTKLGIGDPDRSQKTT